ncbi:MAG: carboxypeptidase-like regulatory domain-containing protein [Acidobacteriaceae bacterium]|nr:carboxypeptidase-like regulatory domain-containing protein [Acidobacteriaceae bacterium]
MKNDYPASSSYPFRFGVVVAVAMLGLLCGSAKEMAGQQTDASPQAVEQVHGVILNSTDKSPVGRVLVTSGDQRMATLTDADGRFSFEVRRVAAKTSTSVGALPSVGLRGGTTATQATTISLTARRPGYISLNFSFRIPADPQIRIAPIKAELVPEGVVRGRLSVPNGDLPDGVQVMLFKKTVASGAASWTVAGTVLANSRGEYRFADLQAGEYKLMTQEWADSKLLQSTTATEVPGYRPAFYGDGADLAASALIHLSTRAMEAEANLELHSATFYRVSVSVANTTPGSGNASYILAVGGEDGPSGFSLRYNTAKQAAEGFLPSGVYDVRVSSFSQQTQSAGLSAAMAARMKSLGQIYMGPRISGATGASKVEVIGPEVKAEKIVLIPNGSISVRVHREYTSAQANYGLSVSQMVYLTPLGMMAQVMPGQGVGDLVVENVREGRYRVQPTQSRGYVASLSSNGMNLLRDPLVVGPGGTSEPIDMTLRDDTATLTGTLTGLISTGSSSNEGDDVPEVTIECIRLDGDVGLSASMTTARNGAFSLSNLAPGRYLVLAARSSSERVNMTLQNLEYRNENVLRDFMSKGMQVTLDASQSAEIQVPLPPEEEN